MIYSYKCSCGESIERDCKIGNQPFRVKCKCGKMAPREYTTNIKFNGSGFYCNDKKSR